MVSIWFAALILGILFSIIGAQSAAWKLLNVTIILGCMALGLGIGYAAGLGTTNFGRVSNAAIPFAVIFGVVAATACVALNVARTKT